MNQTEFFGTGSINKIKYILKKEKPEKIFLVTGKKSYKKSEVKKYISKYLKNYKYVQYNDFSEISQIEDVKKGVKKIRLEKCDLVIAIGGGRVMDFAKLVNIFAFQTENISYLIKNTKKIKNNGKPMIVIPTTSGSGSEATHFAVMYIKEKKKSIGSKYILPKYSIIDPNLTKKLPSKITAISGMDALCQSIESFWSKNATVKTKKNSKLAIKLILENLENAVKKPTRKSRESMSKASNLAGKAINITKTTGPHAVSYPLTYFFKIPHGHAVSLTLSEFFIFNYKITKLSFEDKNSTDKLKKSFLSLLKILEVSNEIEAKEKILEIMKKIHLETKFSELGITKENIPKILKNIDPVRLDNNPRKINKKELEKILMQIM